VRTHKIATERNAFCKAKGFRSLIYAETNFTKITNFVFLEFFPYRPVQGSRRSQEDEPRLEGASRRGRVERGGEEVLGDGVHQRKKERGTDERRR
jgi:hypothetical protein